MPRPLKTLWYWPAKRSDTRWLVRIWILRTARSCSRVSMRAGGPSSGDRDPVEDAADDLVRVDLLRLRLVAHDDAVAEHVGADRLHVLRGHVAAPVQERVRLGGERQRERRARRGAVLDERTQIQARRRRLARREHERHDVILDLVVDVDLVHQVAGRE